MGSIDLHTHSTVSDGTYTPTDLARLARARGLRTFSLTDHDNVSGLDEAAAAAKAEGVELIPGMEMTVDFAGHKLHVVALGFERTHPAFAEFYHAVRESKEAGMAELIAGIRAKGVDITEEKVQALTSGKLDRYAVMRYLVSLHLSEWVQPLWDEYLDPVLKNIGGCENVAAAEAFAAIHAAGGVTSLAHFHKKIGLLGMRREQQAEVITALHKEGLDGMEGWYPSYTPDDSAFVERMTARLGLLLTGGTDFHGANRPGVELGTGRDNNIAVPEEALMRLHEAIDASHRRAGLCDRG